jgi:hypothetical protein
MDDTEVCRFIFSIAALSLQSVAKKKEEIYLVKLTFCFTAGRLPLHRGPNPFAKELGTGARKTEVCHLNALFSKN